MLITTREDYERHCFIDALGRHKAHYQGLELSSAFQPIFDHNMKVFGLEGLLRVVDMKTQQSIPPNRVLNMAQRDFSDVLNIDRLSRAIHLRNFATLNTSNVRIFLNMLPISGEYNMRKEIHVGLMLQRLSEMGISKDNVIFELVEIASLNNELLSSATAYLKNAHFQVAIDDYGTGESNFNRIKLVCPDIIKIDRSMLHAFCQGQSLLLNEVIQYAQVFEAKTVIEGIETRSELEQIEHLGIDYYQGFFLGKPQDILDVSRPLYQY